MKKHIGYMLSISFGISTYSICMDDDQNPNTHPLQKVVVEKIHALKDIYDDGVVPDNKKLDLSNESILTLEDLPKLRNGWELNTLTNIDLSNNYLEKLPAVIFFECPNLQKLNLSHNKLKEIEPNLPAHQHLIALYLHNNQFKSTLPLTYVLNVAPITYLTLHNNPGITDLGILYHKAPHLKQLWVDYTLPDYVKQHIAQKCPNLEAEICNLGTHIQDEHSYTKYTKKCHSTSDEGACWGLFGGCGGFVGVGVSVGLGYSEWLAFGHIVAATAAGFIIGPIIGSQIAVHCCLKAKDRREVILTRKIKKFPPMLKQFISEEPSSDSESSDAHDEKNTHDSWSADEKQDTTQNR